MKYLLLLFLFLENLCFSATCPLEKPILIENLVTEDSIKSKKHIDATKHIMQGGLVAGGILLGWGLLESKELCPQTNSYVNICFNGLWQIVLGIVFLLISSLIFLGRKISDIILHKQAMKNKTK